MQTPRRLLPVVALVVALTCAAAHVAHAGPHARHRRARVLHIVNHIRVHHGLAKIRLDRNVSSYAWHHSLRMARERRLFHSTDLRSHLDRFKPTMWGENVGYSLTLRALVRAWMHSAPHRANILNGRFRHTGIGAVKTRGVYWVTLDLWN